MIQLNDEFYIGEGEIRFCYEHPHNKQLCIKIPRPETTREYTNKELLYFKKLSKRNKSKYSYPFYSDFHHEEATNLGLGQIFDLVRDETTGEISKTLEYYLTENNIIEDKRLKQALDVLKQQMAKHKVFTRDLRARNICCKLNKDDSIELIIIDGIGHRDFFPFADWFHYFSKKKVDRTFTKWHFDSLEDQRQFLIKDAKK
ncbi:YrbL family protein [uncultured Winogradskyella sp.]|uniref:YrbL family protein n=1 Tax=uncultured Winogradskyella sp. TaxID=395353 RepID=UPI002638298A|nr:YrbL family protein [uncultured Winogradskyella sp.]